MYEIFMYVKLYADIECEHDVNGVRYSQDFKGNPKVCGLVNVRA